MQTIDRKEVTADMSTRYNVWTKESLAHYGARERPGHETERRATISDAFAIVFEGLNGPERITSKLVREVFAAEHRTLQQAFVRGIIVPVLEQLVQDGRKGYFDARNEASVAFAEKALHEYLANGKDAKNPTAYVALPTI